MTNARKTKRAVWTVFGPVAWPVFIPKGTPIWCAGGDSNGLIYKVADNSGLELTNPLARWEAEHYGVTVPQEAL